MRHKIPTYSGDDARRALTRRWGLPNTAPREKLGEGHFARCRLLYVDDEDDGRPVAYWIPERVYPKRYESRRGGLTWRRNS